MLSKAATQKVLIVAPNRMDYVAEALFPFSEAEALRRNCPSGYGAYRRPEKFCYMMF